MPFTHADFWTAPDGTTWHALRAPGTRDLSMGALRSWEVERTISWAKAQRMTITDNRAAA